MKVGIVGLGWWSDVLAKALEGSDLIQITSCFSRSETKRTEFAKAFGCDAASSLEIMLASPELAGVIVTTPNSAHLEVVKAAAAAGKHVFVEKPIANDMAEGLEITRLCEAAGVVLSVGHSYRRHSGIRYIHQLIKDGELGRISLAEGVFSKNHGLRLSGPQDWRFQKSELPGGCLMQIGIHHIDNMLFLLGDIVDVSSMMARLETKAEIEDVVSVLLRFSSGALGFVSADYISADRFELTISGTQAVARFDLQRGVSILRQGEKHFAAADVPANDYLKVQLEEFASCVLNGTKPEIGGREALIPLAVIHAAIKSNQERRVVATTEVMPPLAAIA